MPLHSFWFDPCASTLVLQLLGDTNLHVTTLLPVSVVSLSLQLFTEYGRLAMEETFLKPFQVLHVILRHD